MHKMTDAEQKAARRLMLPPRQTTAVEARTCPFCGEQPETEFWHGGGPRKTMVACRNESCAVGPSVTGTTRARTLDLWNIRRG